MASFRIRFVVIRIQNIYDFFAHVNMGDAMGGSMVSLPWGTASPPALGERAGGDGAQVALAGGWRTRSWILEVEIRHLLEELPAGDGVFADRFEEQFRSRRVRLAQRAEAQLLVGELLDTLRGRL